MNCTHHAITAVTTRDVTHFLLNVVTNFETNSLPYASVVVWSQAPSLASRLYSVLQATESWAGPGSEATVVSRDYLSSCRSSTPCPAVCVLLLCCFSSAARSVTFDSTFPFLLRGCMAGSFAVTSRIRRFHIEDPCMQLRFEGTTIPYQLPRRLRRAQRDTSSHCREIASYRAFSHCDYIVM